jgi:hypothetical protein
MDTPPRLVGGGGAGQRGQVDVAPVQGDRAAAELGGEQHVVDESEQPVGVAPDAAQEPGRGAGRQVRLVEDLQVAVDRRQRGAQLVGHPGEELVLDPLGVEQPLVDRRQRAPVLAQFELHHHVPGQDQQAVALREREAARPVVDHAEAAQRVAVRRVQRGAGVEADVRVVDHRRVVGEAGVEPGILDHHDGTAVHGVRAERRVPGRLAGVQADARLEPLSVVVDEADRGHGCVADPGGERRDVVEVALGCRVQDPVPVQRLQSGPLGGPIVRHSLVHGSRDPSHPGRDPSRPPLPAP